MNQSLSLTDQKRSYLIHDSRHGPFNSFGPNEREGGDNVYNSTPMKAENSTSTLYHKVIYIYIL